MGESVWQSHSSVFPMVRLALLHLIICWNISFKSIAVPLSVVVGALAE